MSVDLCFAMDCTGKEKKCMKVDLFSRKLVVCVGSMVEWISKCKDDIQNIVTQILTEYPFVYIFVFWFLSLDNNKQKTYFRDYDDTPPFEILPFTEDVNAFKDFLEKLKANGGDDNCEDVIGGLEECAKLQWSSTTKVLFHIVSLFFLTADWRMENRKSILRNFSNEERDTQKTQGDAPPHNRMYHDGAGDNYPNDTRRQHDTTLRKLQEKGNMRYCIAKLNNSLNKMIRVFKATGYEINLIVEEREMPDIKYLFASVVRFVTEAIQAIRVSKNRESVAAVGIDFGTDGTGFAYSFFNEEVHKEQKWPGRLLAELKCKTNILLDKNGDFVAFGQEAADEYTSNTDCSLEFYERFKMALYDKTLEEEEGKYDTDKKEKDLEPYLTAANGKKRKTIEVLVQAFTFLRKHIMKVLRETKCVKEIEDVQWIVTIPAIWSNTAKNRMREAALRAGLINNFIRDHLIFAFEPGVNQFLLFHFSQQNWDILKKQNVEDDKYILLDLGGGTADIACHQVLDGINVSQIYAPSGGPWGSTYIDEAFWEMLHEIFGREIIEEFKTKYPNESIRLKESFRQAKHNYDPVSSKPQKVKIKELVIFMKKHQIDLKVMSKKVQEYKLKNKSGVFELDEDIGTLYLGHEGWKFLMDKVIDPLVEHVHKLLMEPELKGCKTMLCVGGLSTSPYVMQRLRDTFVTDHKMIKTISKPNQPILAVVEGAVRFGVAPSLIAKYVMPYTYGLKCARLWATSDEEDKKLWSEKEMSYIFEDGFEIFVSKGAKMHVQDPPKVKYFQPLNEGEKVIIIEIHRSTEENPKQCTNETYCGQASFDLPDNWWNGVDATTKEIPVAFFFNKTEIQVKVELENYPEDRRFIKIEWERGV
ncbi:hypothetical protein RFI_01025 [Reticulomyxa filosa]|uniref:Uncharacterized protein n=1 Tax=Reticulomyxa filosa TaxID=46433 RepID=X6PDA4_RETFI|nr:hypothetical protein RFI_01025 [Reticulomyxa filosa]|eukprot:ETO36039.1 hypothetical protein RFI_01025 [Reticulomyxa filosa]